MCDNISFSAPHARAIVEPIAASIPYTPSSLSPHYHQTGTPDGPSTSVHQLPAARKAKTPRPRNAFIFFRTHFLDSNPHLAIAKVKQPVVSKLASNIWNQLTEAERMPFMARAKEEKKQHKILYPNYKYEPKRSQKKEKKPPAKKARATPATSSRAKRPRRALSPTVEVAWSPATSSSSPSSSSPSSSSPSSSSPSSSSPSPGWYSSEHISSRDVNLHAATYAAVPSHEQINWAPSPVSPSSSTSYPATPQTSPQQPSSWPLFPELGSMQEHSVLDVNPFTGVSQLIQQPYFAQEWCTRSLDGYSGQQFGFNVDFSLSTGYPTLPYSPYSAPSAPNMFMHDNGTYGLSPDLAYPFAGGAHQSEALSCQLDENAPFSFEDFLQFSPEPNPASSLQAMTGMY